MITKDYTDTHTTLVKKWIQSPEGRGQLKLSLSESHRFCDQYDAHIQLLSWTADNPFHTKQLEDKRKKEANYTGPAPEVVRALLRLRGLELANADDLGLLLEDTEEPMTLLQQNELATILQANQSSMSALQWATVLRSTNMSPEMKNRVDSSVNSADSVTWLHQWVKQSNCSSKLTVPTVQPKVELGVIGKSNHEIPEFEYELQSILYQPAHLRHMIFSETLVTGYKGICTLSPKHKQLWFMGWLIDLVAFGNIIGEYMTRPMMDRVLSVYHAIMNPANTTQEKIFSEVEKRYFDIALSLMPANQPLAREMNKWSTEKKNLFTRLIGQFKSLTPKHYIDLVRALNEEDVEDKWLEFYKLLLQNPQIPNPTFVPLLLEKLRATNPQLQLSQTILVSGKIMVHLFNQYKLRYEGISESILNGSSQPARAAQELAEAVTKLGPLNVHGIAGDPLLLQNLLAFDPKEFDPVKHLNLKWPDNGQATPKAEFRAAGCRTPSPDGDSSKREKVVV